MAVGTATLDDVKAAQARIRAHDHRTPLLHSATLSELTGTDLWLRAENLQKTGSFKPRGAINAALQLTPEECARGVIGVSAGNYAAALAFGARMAGTRATLVIRRRLPVARWSQPRGTAGRWSWWTVTGSWRAWRRSSARRDRLSYIPSTTRTSSPAMARSGWSSPMTCRRSRLSWCRRAEAAPSPVSPQR